MIIECPACSTRYDIKAELPADGRTVRCAKCGTVWRAMPESGGENAEAFDLSSAELFEERQETKKEAPTGQTAQDCLTTTGAREELFEWPSYEEPAATREETDADEEADAKAEADEGRLNVDARFMEEHENSGKVSWFSSFRRKKKQIDEAEDRAARTKPQASAETIPFPRIPSPVQQKTMEMAEGSTLDAARQAVRSVFASLGHSRPVSNAEMFEDSNESAALSGRAPRMEDRWPERFAQPPDLSKKSGDWSVPEGDGGRSGDAGGERHFQMGEDDAWFAEKKDGAIEDGDPDAALREAMRAHFLSGSSRTQGGSSLVDVELTKNLETHLKSAVAAATETQAKPAGVAGLWAKTSPAADEDVFEPEPAVEEEPVEVRDDDAAFDHRLYREIEETQEKSGETRRRGRGGLALAAAWGLFICVASGLIVGFFAFRDILADAAPGLASLYRMLGTPVTVQPLVFESIRYEWSTLDNKPVLTVRGSVFNRAHRKVNVPQFFVTVKDQDPAFDREYSAKLKIGGTRIRSNERADFDIELASPNRTVTAVELELRNVR